MENKKIKLRKLIKLRRSGFTLVEVLIALFLLFIVISAASALVSRALDSVQSTKSKLIAAYLIQEGIEIVRNIRDKNWVNENSWDNGLPEGDWEIDYQNQSLSAYNITPSYLKVDSNGFYNYTNGSSTIFKRKITIQIIPDNQDYHLRVISGVSWTQKGRDYSLSAIEDLYNWYEATPATPPTPPTPPTVCDGLSGYAEASGCNDVCTGCSEGICTLIPYGIQDIWGSNQCTASYTCRATGAPSDLCYQPTNCHLKNDPNSDCGTWCPANGYPACTSGWNNSACTSGASGCWNKETPYCDCGN